MQKNIKYFIVGRVILKQLALIMTVRFLILTGRYFAKDISADGEIRMTGLTVWTKGDGVEFRRFFWCKEVDE